jgi:hypothetical protein
MAPKSPEKNSLQSSFKKSKTNESARKGLGDSLVTNERCAALNEVSDRTTIPSAPTIVKAPNAVEAQVGTTSGAFEEGVKKGDVSAGEKEDGDNNDDEDGVESEEPDSEYEDGSERQQENVVVEDKEQDAKAQRDHVKQESIKALIMLVGDVLMYEMEDEDDQRKLGTVVRVMRKMDVQKALHLKAFRGKEEFDELVAAINAGLTEEGFQPLSTVKKDALRDMVNDCVGVNELRYIKGNPAASDCQSQGPAAVAKVSRASMASSSNVKSPPKKGSIHDDEESEESLV